MIETDSENAYLQLWWLGAISNEKILELFTRS